MELKLYLRMILRRWWLVAAAFVVTVVLTGVLVSRQPWIYEATTTFVIRPRPDFTEAADDFVRAIDTLSRQTDINTTFSQVASSKAIKRRAFERLALSDEDREGLKISGAAIAGSSILEIAVQGPKPGVVRDVADAVGAESAVYMRQLYDVFELELIDEASLPSTPVSPNKALTMVVGAVLGLMLGVALVFVTEYLQQPLIDETAFNIIDAESGLYNRAYFLNRLNQEMSRVEDSEHIFSLALITLKSRRLATGIQETISSGECSSLLVTALAPSIRKEDVLARVDDERFALVLPAMSKDAADALMNTIQEQVRLHSAEDGNIDSGATVDLIAVTLTVSSENVHRNHEELFEQAMTLMSENEKSVRQDAAGSDRHGADLLFLTRVEKKESPDRKSHGRRQVGD